MDSETKWYLSSVGGQFDIQLGKMLDAARNTGKPRPYLGNRAVQWGRIDPSAAGIAPMSARDILRYRLIRGDLLVCEGGEVGRAAIWDNEITECYYQKALHRLRPKGSYNSRLMLAFLEYWSSTGFFSNFTMQTSIAHLPKEAFLQMPLPVPSPEEQDRLAAVIDDVSNYAFAVERLIVKKQAMKQGMMQQLLTGRTRLQGFVGEWFETSLGQVVTLQRGFDLPARNRQAGTVPIVTSSGVSGFHNRAKVAAPGVITGRYGTIGTVFFQKVDFWPHNTTLWVSNFYENDPFFVYYLLQRVDFAAHSGKSGVPGVNRNDLHSERIRVPPSVMEQAEIARVLVDIDSEIDALRLRLAKAQDVKQGMMQQLLTGRTRLAVQE